MDGAHPLSVSAVQSSRFKKQTRITAAASFQIVIRQSFRMDSTMRPSNEKLTAHWPASATRVTELHSAFLRTSNSRSPTTSTALTPYTFLTACECLLLISTMPLQTP